MGSDRAVPVFVGALFALVGVFLLLRGKYGPPYEGAKLSDVSSRYGMRLHPIHGDMRLHNGIDFRVPIGTPLLSPRAGTVVAVVATDSSSSGIWVKVRFGDSWSVTYLHCSAIVSRVGDVVSRGQLIAYSGNTGGSTGPHLHYILRGPDGKSVDPLPHLGLS